MNMQNTNRISEITRRDIFDFLSISNINIYGRLDEIDFLMRIFDLKNMPSTDGRFSNAYSDIWQHRINNYDWDDDWIFSDSRLNLFRCDDNIFLNLLCEIVNPIVRPDMKECENIVEHINSFLKNDNFELYASQVVSGKNKYSTRMLTPYTINNNIVKDIVVKVDSTYISKQISRMNDSIDNDPENAIGTAKEFIETICKTILSDYKKENIDKLDFNELVKETRTVLDILPKNIDKEIKGSEAFKKILQAASSMIDGMGEIRNLYGTGHGKTASSKGLQPRHARLTVGIACTLGRFLFDCYERKKKE
ncbi:MAG: abortive infection family protein [Deltaproteobacteria bacterium]|jgi:hypothetical protein|nr:abortive infection family protein [Deltaproteobacteria bacterium]